MRSPRPAIIVPFMERRVREMMIQRGVISRTIATPAGSMHVYDARGTGSLPTVVILHGISASGVGFVPIMMRLRSQAARVLVPDYPGHGLNPDPQGRLTLDALFDSVTAGLDDLLGGEPYALVGNSLGGLVALDYASKRPERCRGVVLLSPAGAASSPEEWDELMAAFGMKTRREALAFMSRIYHRVPLAARLVAHELPSNVRRRGVQDLFGSVSRDRSVPVSELAKLTMPILFTWGTSERLLPASHLDWWKKHLPAHAIVEQPDSWGHCPHFDQPAAVVDRIASFLRPA